MQRSEDDVRRHLGLIVLKAIKDDIEKEGADFKVNRVSDTRIVVIVGDDTLPITIGKFR